MSSQGVLQTGETRESSLPRRGERTGADEDGDGDSERLSCDAAFEILSNRRRRFVLYYLRGREEPAALSDLVRTVAAWENGVAPEELDYKQRKRTYTSLYQTHLPTMADSGVVEYGRSRDDIRLTERASALDVYLDPTPDGAPAWQGYYLALAAVGAVLLGGRTAGAYPLSLLPTAAISGAIVAAFFVTALAHVYQARASGASHRPDPLEPGADE